MLWKSVRVRRLRSDAGAATPPWKPTFIESSPRHSPGLPALGVEEQRVNVIIYLDGAIARRTGLEDGYRVEASIVVWTGRDKLLVPGGAVFRQDDGWATYVLSNGRTRLRPVELGRKNSAQVEVLNGLDPGEQVVLYPTDRVRDGARAAAK